MALSLLHLNKLSALDQIDIPPQCGIGYLDQPYGLQHWDSLPILLPCLVSSVWRIIIFINWLWWSNWWVLNYGIFISSWPLSASTLTRYSHFMMKSSPSPFDLSLPYSMIPFFSYTLFPVATWCIFTDCLVSILLTGIIIAHDRFNKENWHNKFVRGVQGQNQSSLVNLGLKI